MAFVSSTGFAILAEAEPQPGVWQFTKSKLSTVAINIYPPYEPPTP
jgi:hypothetical protein